MATGNCVADVRKLATAALKSGHKFNGQLLKPSQWAAEAGYHNSAASPLRKHMARDSGNGCGRSRRYPAMTAETLLETLDLADQYQAEKEQRKRERLSKSIGTKVRPATVRGAQSAKRQAKANERAKSTARKGTAKKASSPAKVKAQAQDAPTPEPVAAS